MKLYLVLVCIVLSLLTYTMNIESMSVKQNEEKSKLIIGGIEAKPGEFPYQVVIENKFSEKKDKFQCGGVILDDRHILTAAHCVLPDSPPFGVADNELFDGADISPKNFTVIVGVHNRKNHLFGKRYGIDRVIYHKNFYGKTEIMMIEGVELNITRGENDIALLKTKKPIKFNKSGSTKSGPVDKVILPEPNTTYSEDEILILSGWGRVYCSQDAPGSDVLLTTKFEIRPDQECFIEGESNRICAKGVDGSSFFRGDSGGGAVRMVENHYELVGIVSHIVFDIKLGCSKPVVYTRVESYLNWIDHWMKA